MEVYTQIGFACHAYNLTKSWCWLQCAGKGNPVSPSCLCACTASCVWCQGAGVTPYSRRADGRAVMRSSLRGVAHTPCLFCIGTNLVGLCAVSRSVSSHAAHGLGIHDSGLYIAYVLICRVWPFFARAIVPGRPVMRGGLVARRIRGVGGAASPGRAHHARALAGRHRRRGRAGHVLQVRSHPQPPDVRPVRV